MPVVKPHIQDGGMYFITFTNYRWMPLIHITNSYDLVYKWFDYLKEKGHYIIGYVIMPNHVHVIIAFRDSEKSINKIAGDGKRFIAYGIVKRLLHSQRIEILQQLANAVRAKDRSRGKKHEVFQPSFDMKQCGGLKYIKQKLAYIHANPVVKKWSLAADSISYPHSSARFYETGLHGGYEVTNFIDLFDIDWISATNVL